MQWLDPRHGYQTGLVLAVNRANYTARIKNDDPRRGTEWISIHDLKLLRL